MSSYTYKLPLEVLETIFSFVDSKCLINKCRLVCKQWKELIDNDVMPRRALKTARDRELYQDVDLGVREYYIVEKLFNKNLIQNPNFELKPMNIASAFLNSLSPTFVRNSNGEIPFWKTNGPYQREKPPTGINEDTMPVHILKKNKILDHQQLPVLATSYSGTQQYQDILLSDLGIDDVVMDEIRPVIVAEEWFGTRFDCGTFYVLEIQLFRQNSDKPVSVKSLHINTLVQGIGVWRKAQVTLSNYGKGVRRIRFSRVGRDNQYWAGFYGTKFALCQVYLQLPKH